MKYEPNVNDYVVWKNQIEGWVYFKCDQYITIEILVTPRHTDDVGHTPFHRNDRLLVICYRPQWKELKYIKSRLNANDSTTFANDGTSNSGLELQTSSN